MKASVCWEQSVQDRILRKKRNRILHLLSGLPDYLDLTVGRQDLHLVHSFPGHDRGTRIWGQMEPDSVSPCLNTICTIAVKNGKTAVKGCIKPPTDSWPR